MVEQYGVARARKLAAPVLVLLHLTSCAPSSDRIVHAFDPVQGPLTTLEAGSTFVDPQGQYEIDVGPAWTRLPSTVALEIETWAVAPETSGFTPNVNVLVHEFPGETPAEYIAYSGKGGGGIVRKQADVIDLGRGRQAARFVFSQGQDSLQLLSLGVAVTTDDRAVLATLTTADEDFDRLSAEIEPFLRTLRLPKP